MKKRLLGCIAFIVLLLSIMLSMSYRFAQSADASAPAVQWSQTYAGATASSVIQTSDQGYLIISSPEISSPDTVLELIKADSVGNQVWVRTYPGFPSGVLAAQTADGGYVIAGTVNVENRNQFFLAKLDSNGATTWNKTYGDTNNDAVSNLIITSDGGYAVLGNSINYTTYDSKALLFKVDSDGNQIWNKTYGGSNYFHVYGLSQASDGGYLIVATITHRVIHPVTLCL